jgi:O-antigen biosynthesis alpha-1,2-mannosyltransferase
LRTIALDATYSIGNELSGVGVYSRELMWALAAAHPETQFAFCYRPHRYFASWSTRLPRNARRRLLAEPVGPRRAALFHGLNQRLPRIPMRRAVATFHDLFVLSGEYSTPEFRARFGAQARDAAARADLIVTVSEFTKSQVTGLLGVKPDRIRVVRHGIRPLATARLPRERIILHVGAIQTRKNITRLVEAFEGVDASWRLVLAGSCGFGSAEILERIARSPARERIQVTGYVTQDALAGWYSQAQIFAFPSLDEGFGMPLLEAMTAGIPVLTSNRAALPEVAGDAALLVDAERTEAIAEGLRELTRNEHLRQNLVIKGMERAGEFSWEKAARETWDAYGELLR